MFKLIIFCTGILLSHSAPTPDWGLDNSLLDDHIYHAPIISAPIIKPLLTHAPIITHEPLIKTYHEPIISHAPIITHEPLIKTYHEPIITHAPIIKAAPIIKTYAPATSYATVSSYHISHTPIVKTIVAAPPILKAYAPSWSYGGYH